MSSDSSTTTDPAVADDTGETRKDRFRIAPEAATSDSPAAVRYERGKELARGGLGRVTSALDRTLQREVAIKELHQRTEQGVRRFVREGLTTARLQHPAIVPILDIGTWEGGDPFLVMKLLEGKTLAEEMAVRTTTDARIALLPNLLAVADALGFAHERGVVHRDVKPSNIMVGTHGETVLLDWGVAFDATASELETGGKGRGPEVVALSPEAPEQLTVAGSLAGTVRYMSPEQARGEPTVPAFDVYSLGITIASVLAGRMPFDGNSQPEIFEAIRSGRSAIPVLPDDISPDLAAIIAKATSPPVERYVHAGQLADDLRRYIAGQLVTARRYTRRQLVARWLRRNRVYVGAAGAVLAIVAIVAVVAVRRVIAERNVAIVQREAADARARALVLLQARANLRADPTATLAWLKQYPEDAPHADEVLALVDEAESRGVAKHVLRAPSHPADATPTLDSSALVVAHRDGTLVRVELASGARRELVAIGKPFLLVRDTPAGLIALDEDGGVLRVGKDGTVAHLQRVALPSRPLEMFFIERTNQLKIVFAVEEAMFVPLSSPAQARVVELPAELENYEFEDDGNNSETAYVLQPNGDLFALETPPRKLWRFTTGTWIGSSPTATAYLAIVPGPKGRGMGEDVSIWVGKLSGEPPVRLGSMRACEAGANRYEEAEVTDDASVALVTRCGAMRLFAGGSVRDIANGERVSTFDISPDGRNVVLGRSGAIELVDVRSGARRELAGAGSITTVGFSPDSSWVFSLSGEQGTRAWLVNGLRAPEIGKLADSAAPARLAIAIDRTLVIRRQLECSRWRGGAIAATFGLSPMRARDLDDDPLLWSFDVSVDGRACVFAAQGGGVVVATDDGAAHELRDARELGDCVFSRDAARVTCTLDRTAIATFDIATGARTALREIDADALRGFIRYRDKPIVLAVREAGCVLEDLAGATLATLGGRDCVGVRASPANWLGRESALLVVRPSSVVVWMDTAKIDVPTETGLVEVSAERGLVAVAREQTIEVWDLATRSRRPGPPPHAHAIERMAWSQRGTLASSDDETIRLWDPITGLVRILHAPHVRSIVWAESEETLFTTDGRTVEAWPIDMRRGPTRRELRDRLDQLTSARIVDGRVESSDQGLAAQTPATQSESSAPHSQ